MEINRRALYNSLRMNWVMKPTSDIDPWQIEDYRSIPLDVLFERLEDRSIHVEKSSFIAFAETVDTPEELTDALIGDIPDDMELYDQIYLVIFELWRRLVPEKPCLSILCDDLDQQIYLYDRGELSSGGSIEDALANLQVILDENCDRGIDPYEAFDCINGGCANDVEDFLYDFISEEIDNGNGSYAMELIEGFDCYIRDTRWFDFLKARVISFKDPQEANQMVKQLINKKNQEPDLEFNFEILLFLVAYGDKDTFTAFVKKTGALLKTEEDFQELLSICIDFFHRLDREDIERAFERILNERDKRDLSASIHAKDPHFLEVFKILAQG